MKPKPDNTVDALWRDRTVRLLGDDSRLASAHVLLVGLGGVGGYCFESLVRAGIGAITVVDGDRIDVTNLNRQILATRSTVGLYKTEAAQTRAADINPDLRMRVFCCRYNADTSHEILDRKYDYAADAIDSIADKVLLITECRRLGIPIVSAMGAGNRLDDDFMVTDVFRTQYDGLARVMRRRLKEKGITKLSAVASGQPPFKYDGAPASISYPPAVAGCKMAGHIIRSLLQ